MTGAETLDVARDAIWTIVMVSSPLMVVGLVVGVVVSLFQALTQIQEQTLVFVPKILAIFVDTAVGAAVHGGHAARPHDADIVANHRRLMHMLGPCASTSRCCRRSPPPSCWCSPASARW